MNVNRVIEEIVEHRDIAIPIWKTLDVQPEELSEGKFIDINEESSYDQKNEDVLEKVTSAKNLILKILEIL